VWTDFAASKPDGRLVVSRIAWWSVTAKPFRFPAALLVLARLFRDAGQGPELKPPSEPLVQAFITSAISGALTSSPDRSRKTVIVARLPG
jgi:hypothetical protein